jgi:hypothetical protein
MGQGPGAPNVTALALWHYRLCRMSDVRVGSFAIRPSQFRYASKAEVNRDTSNTNQSRSMSSCCWRLANEVSHHYAPICPRISTSPCARRANHRPTGKSVSSPAAKNISLPPSGKSALPACPVLSRQEGRIAIVTNAGGDAVDAAASARVWFAGRFSVSEQRRAGRTTLFAYGKTVWSRHPLLVPSCRWRIRSDRIGTPSSRQRR